MNCGKSIVLVYLFFVVGIVYLVYRSSQQTIDLVDKNYYQKEIQFQNEIDATNNANKHGLIPTIKKIDNIEYLVIPDTSKSKLHGLAHFYCPSNSKNDVMMELPLSTNGKWTLPSKQIKSSAYQVKVNWVNESKDTFQSVINYSK